MSDDESSPYASPKEVIEPRRVGPLTAMFILALSIAAGIIAFVGTCLPISVLTLGSGVSPIMADLLGISCFGFGLTVAILFSRWCFRRQRALNNRLFEVEHRAQIELGRVRHEVAKPTSSDEPIIGSEQSSRKAE